MWVSGGRAFQAERTASAKALGQERACLRPAWLDLSEEGGERRQGTGPDPAGLFRPQ